MGDLGRYLGSLIVSASDATADERSVRESSQFLQVRGRLPIDHMLPLRKPLLQEITVMIFITTSHRKNDRQE